MALFYESNSRISSIFSVSRKNHLNIMRTEDMFGAKFLERDRTFYKRANAVENILFTR